MQTVRRVQANAFTALPEALRHRGAPSRWARQARPGQELHSFLEAPVFDADGNLWLVDVAFGRLFRIDPDGHWDTVCTYEGEPHGIAPLDDGSFALSDHRLGLLRFDPGSDDMTVLCPPPTGEGFRGLNDIARASNGDLWFTDPGRSSLSDPTGRLFCLAAGADTPRRVLDNIPYPNGVAFSPDGRHVYVAATRANAVWRLDSALPDHGVPMTGLFVQLSGGLGPDGLAMSPDGYLAIAQAQAGRAYLVDPAGDVTVQVDTPGGPWTTAVAFDRTGQTLVIVEARSGTVYAVSRAQMRG